MKTKLVIISKPPNDSTHSTTTTVAITIYAPSYVPTDEWPSPYNGVTPDSSLGSAFNNIGFYDAAGSTIYTCLRVSTGGLPVSVGGIGEFVEHEGRLESCRPYQSRDIRKLAIALGALLPERISAREL